MVGAPGLAPLVSVRSLRVCILYTLYHLDTGSGASRSLKLYGIEWEVFSMYSIKCTGLRTPVLSHVAFQDARRWRACNARRVPLAPSPPSASGTAWPGPNTSLHARGGARRASPAAALQAGQDVPPLCVEDVAQSGDGGRGPGGVERAVPHKV